MIALLLTSLGLAFVCLVLASQLPAPYWPLALDGLALALSAAALVAVAGGLRRLPRSLPGSRLALPVVSSAVAVALRGWLLEWLSPPEAVARIDYVRLQLGALAGAAAAVALVSSAAALSRSEHPATLVAAGLAMTGALYVAGPALTRAGLPLDHRTFLGLAGLGVGAWAVVEAHRHISRGRAR